MRTFKEQAENWWNDLSERQKELAFFSVIQKVSKAELNDRSSYRTILYEVFEFGPHMYGLGMECGFLALHNSITLEDIQSLRLKNTALECKVKKLEKAYEELCEEWDDLATEKVLVNILGEKE